MPQTVSLPRPPSPLAREIIHARSLAFGAAHSLSIADAYAGRDARRADRAVADAIDALDAARARLAALPVHRPPPATLQAVAGLVLIAAPLAALLAYGGT